MTNTEVMLRFYDEVNAGNLGIIDELIHDDLIEHDPIAPTPDKDGVRQFFAMATAAFPDMRIKVLRTVAEGDLVMAPTASSRAPTTATSWASRRPGGGSASRWSTSCASATGARPSSGA
jgi:predicted SnoaL-like aldol condensation-catalyzing enzyme